MSLGGENTPDLWHLAFADFHGINMPTTVDFKTPTFKHLTSKIPEYLAIGCHEPGWADFGTALLSLRAMPSECGFDGQGDRFGTLGLGGR